MLNRPPFKVAQVAPAAFLLALFGLHPGWAENQQRAIIIGIRNYPGDALGSPSLLFANKDAALFEKYATGRPGEKFAQIATLADPDTSLFRLRAQLKRIISGADKGDTVYVFISARGIARPGSREGYISTASTASTKPESTAIAVSELKEMIENSGAAQVFVFADVCREPPYPGFQNQINFRLAELGALPNHVVAGVLASDASRPSKEHPGLVYEREAPGFGVFSYFLVSALSGKPGSDGRRLQGIILAPDLYSYLKNEIPSTTNRTQIPQPLGSGPAAKSVPIWRAALTPDPLRRDRPLVAALRWIPGLLAMQLARPVSGEEALLAQLLQPGQLQQPEKLADRVLALPRDGNWTTVRDRVAAALADSGQLYVTRYGTTDLLPGDPLKVRESDFEYASRAFESALRLTENDRSSAGIRAMLEQRRWFCSGRAKLPALSALADLNRARGAAIPPIPEIDDAMGIYYLESKEKNYARAAEHFRSAKQLAPRWMYPRHNLALTYMEQGDYAAAEREYRDAISLAPYQPYLYYNLGLLLHRTNRRKEARAAYRRALDVYKEASGALRARSAEWTNDFPEESRVALARADVFARNEGEVLNAMGALAQAEGDNQRALEYYRNAAQVNPGLYPARHNEAVLTQKQYEQSNPAGVSDAAVRLYEENLRRFSGFNPSRVKLAQLELRKNQLAEARSHFEAVLRDVNDNVEARTGLTEIEAAEGHYDRAIGILRETIDQQIRTLQKTQKPGKSPGTSVLAQPALYEQLARTQDKAGDHASACQSYDLAAKALKGAVYEGNKRQLEAKARNCRKAVR